MKLSIALRKKARIEMLPLIDIVFLLLVFFIYAMLSMAVHRGMAVALPESAEVAADNTLETAVSISADGSVYLDRQPVPLEKLPAILLARRIAGELPGVLVFGDRDLDYQRLFQVLDAIGRAGVTNISLQAELDSVR